MALQRILALILSLALVDDVTLAPTLVVADLAVSDHMPMIRPTCTQFDITKDRANVFRVCFTDPFQGEIMAQYAKNILGAKTTAVMRNNSNEYSDDAAKAFLEKAKELGIEIVAEESYGNDDKDCRSQLTNINTSKPDVLVIPDYYQMDVSAYNTIEGSNFTNLYLVMDSSERVQNFFKSYNVKFNEEPSAFSALAYDGAIS